MAVLLLSPCDAFLASKMAPTGRHRTAAKVAQIPYNINTESNESEILPAPRPVRKPLHRPVHRNVCPQTGVTLSRYMMEMERLNPELSEVESIFTSIQVGCKAISNLVRKSALQSNTGYAFGGGSINVQGEVQTKMDLLANDVLKNALQWAGHFKTIASEEEDEPLSTGTGTMEVSDPAGVFPEAIIDSGASYIAVFDPLDGSANIDAGIPVGTIFGIFQHTDDDCSIDNIDNLCLDDVLQPGRNLVAAGYCLYSSATTLVLTLGAGTHGFTLDETIGEFVLTHPNMKIPERGSIYSFNEGNRCEWDQPIQDYIADIQQGTGQTGAKYKGRYVGSMVADVHRTLQYGGIFGYPADHKSHNGKLRLLYEAAPMAFLVEQAGGVASTGNRPIMDVLPTDVHARVPCILGSPDDVQELMGYYAKIETTRAESNGLDFINDGEGLYYA
jgi:fructose-1,6-bisphosphatase I